MSVRPRISVDTTTEAGRLIRRWLLQLGADPVEASEPEASDLPKAPQHQGVSRDEVAALVRRLKGKGHPRGERFDDHGSVESWPRGSY
ncbi:MAG: hypothetical protein ACLGHZ_01245 [Actinomycetes bacterium]